ncbi:ABC transporter permease [Acrocarpospora sp. B8E8]|uniref:ABC transporter permease n=1 Tax=Acrocarpospora sp. B8E8 TaxID=3153572 RepID=UPI00325E6A0E
MKILAIGLVSARGLVRDRTNVFFVILFPLLLVLVLGTAFGGSYQPRLGIVDADRGALSQRLVEGARQAAYLRVELVPDERTLRADVEHGRLQAGLAIPAGYERALRAGGRPVLRQFARQDLDAQQIALAVRGAIARELQTARAARFAQREARITFDQALGIASSTSAALPRVTVTSETTGTPLLPQTLGRYDLGASSQLILFVFLTSLTAASGIITGKRLGVARRMLATPTPVRVILAGEAAGRMAVAVAQGLIIMLGSALLFGVRWGDPLGAAAVLLMFSLVGSGAAMLVGSVLRTEQQAIAVGLFLGLGLGALGGSMAPLEVFSPPVRIAAHFTPHAWASDAFAELVRRGGGLADVLPQLGVLAAFAAVLFALGTWRLRRTLT